MNKSVIIAITFAAVAAGALALESANGSKFWDRPQVDPGKYMRLITADSLQRHIEFLASDALAGRYVGTNGLEQARKYLIDSYRAMHALPLPGFSNYRQRFNVYRETPNSVTFSVSTDGEVILETRFGRGSPADAFPVSANVTSGSFGVVFAGFGIDDDTLGYSDFDQLKQDQVTLEDKWVLVFDGEPAGNDDASLLWRGGTAPTGWSTRQFFEKRGAVMRYGGAEGLLVVSDLGPEGQGFHAQALEQAETYEHAAAPMMLDTQPRPMSLPKLVRVSTRFADSLLQPTGKSVAWLHRAIVETGSPSSFPLPGVRLQMDVERPRSPIHADNVIAVIEGTDLKDEYVLVTSHYDHNGTNPLLDGDRIYNGAADDASGVAGSLEIARAFAQAKSERNGPRRTIVFLNTSAEERGILGSAHFADHDQAVPLEKVTANVNLDGIGGFDKEHLAKPYVYVIESDALGGGLTDMVMAVKKSNDIGILIETDKDFDSDHLSFASYLIPYLYFSTGYTEHYHKVSDEASTIDYDHVEAITRLAFGAIWRLANDDNAPTTDRAHLRSTVGFQCPPCGVTPHDDRVHERPGYCPTCGMRLVPVRKE